MKLRRLRRYQADHFKPRLKDIVKWAYQDHIRKLTTLQRVPYSNLFKKDPE